MATDASAAGTRLARTAGRACRRRAARSCAGSATRRRPRSSCVFFLVPLGLVVWMSVNHWPLLGDADAQRPGELHRASPDNQLFVRRGLVHAEVHGDHHGRAVALVALGLALLVQDRRRGVGFFRTAFFLPGAVGFAAASLLFYGLLQRRVGPLDELLRASASSTSRRLARHARTRALVSTIAMVVWRFAGFNMLILLTGLQSIPTDVYEAARVDGADALADLPPHHAAAAAPDDRADARADRSPARCWPSTSSSSSPAAARTTAR